MPFPWETIPPLAIICGATALMGALPHGIQLLSYGKPKAVLQDAWDRQVGRRDERIMQEWQDKQDEKVTSYRKYDLACTLRFRGFSLVAAGLTAFYTDPF